jgi:hypothetical protein
MINLIPSDDQYNEIVEAIASHHKEAKISIAENGLILAQKEGEAFRSNILGFVTDAFREGYLTAVDTHNRGEHFLVYERVVQKPMTDMEKVMNRLANLEKIGCAKCARDKGHMSC